MRNDLNDTVLVADYLKVVTSCLPKRIRSKLPLVIKYFETGNHIYVGITLGELRTHFPTEDDFRKAFRAPKKNPPLCISGVGDFTWRMIAQKMQQDGFWES